MKTGKISAAKLRTLSKPGVYGDGGGLYLQVRDADRRTWIYRYTLAGKARWMGLGAERDVSMAKAREAATAARRLVRQGVDPIEQRRGERAEEADKAGLNTFAEVADRYIAAHEASWRNPKHRQQWRNTLDTYALPIMGKIGVAAIGTGEVTRVLEAIWHDKPETATRLRGRIEAVLDYATARGWRTGENPARWRGHLANLMPARAKLTRVEHHPALAWREIGGFMGELRAEAGIGARALELTILAAARTGEVIGARWPEFDLDAAVWTVPADRMKAGREHRIPLSDAAVTILRPMMSLRDDATGGFVFPGARRGKPISNMTMSATLRRMGRDTITVHGFRSAFRDWCAEATGYDRETAESALAHTLRDKVEAAYRRGDMMDKRRRLMADWAIFCARPAPAGEVVPLRAGMA